MAIKAESVEQFSLEVIFPSSNYEAAMPKLHRHVTAAEVLEESFYSGAYMQNTIQGKKNGKGDLMGSPMAWDCRHGAALPCSTAMMFVSLLSAIPLKDKHTEKRIHFKGYIFQMSAWRLQLSLSFLPIPIRPMQRSFVALMKTI